MSQFELITLEPKTIKNVRGCFDLHNMYYGSNQNYNNFTAKFLKFWAICAVSGAKMILGHRDDYNILQETSVLPPDELWNESLYPEEDKQRCYTFMNRLLDFIKEQFPQNDRSLVKHFKWDKDIQIVSIHFNK